MEKHIYFIEKYIKIEKDILLAEMALCDGARFEAIDGSIEAEIRDRVRDCRCNGARRLRWW